MTQTEISKAAFARATDLIRAEQPLRSSEGTSTMLARTFARFIQEVNDAARASKALAPPNADSSRPLGPFILPEPVDPLLGVAEEAMVGTAAETAIRLRAELAKRGLKIVEAADGNP